MMPSACSRMLWQSPRYYNNYYVLRKSPSFTSSSLLGAFDGVLRALLESICNIQLSDLGWIQASLPVIIGGLGIRSVTMLAPSAFLASAAGTSEISIHSLSTQCRSTQTLEVQLSLCRRTHWIISWHSESLGQTSCECTCIQPSVECSRPYHKSSSLGITTKGVWCMAQRPPYFRSWLSNEQ